MSCKAWGVPIRYALNEILQMYFSSAGQIACCFVLRSLAAASGILLPVRERLKHDRSSSADVLTIISNAHQYSIVSACAAERSCQVSNKIGKFSKKLRVTQRLLNMGSETLLSFQYLERSRFLCAYK